MKHLTVRYRGALSSVLIFSILIFVISCKKEPKPPPSTSAKGFLTSFEQSCNPSGVHGIWYNGISAGTDSNYVEVALNVTSAGSYNITSDKLNGVSFSAAGSFSSTGVYKVRLKPSGTFINWGPTSFPFKFDSSSCNFIVYVQDSAALSMPANTWEMTASGNYYHGPGTGGLNLPPGEATAFRFSGSGAPGNTDIIGMFLDFSTTEILDTIPYSLSTYGNSFHISAMDTAKSFPASYLINAYSSLDYSPASSMTLHIRSMLPMITDDTYKTVVYGTFDGTAVDLWHQNRVVPITKGRFKAIY